MKHSILHLACCMLFVACKKQGPKGETGAQGQTGPPGPALTGTICGTVTQFDELVAIKHTNLNTVTVTIKGTGLTAVTDTDGKYTIPSVPAGTHTLEFKGQNTQVMKKTEVIFPGNGLMYVHARIVNKPTWTLSNFNLTIDLDSKNYVLTCTSPSNPSLSQGVLVLFSLKQNMDPQNITTYDYALSGAPNNYISLYNYYAPRYPTGTTFYAKVYPLVSGFYYTDVATQRNVYYPVGDIPSSVFTLTMPDLQLN